LKQGLSGNDLTAAALALWSIPSIPDGTITGAIDWSQLVAGGVLGGGQQGGASHPQAAGPGSVVSGLSARHSQVSGGQGGDCYNPGSPWTPVRTNSGMTVHLGPGAFASPTQSTAHAARGGPSSRRSSHLRSSGGGGSASGVAAMMGGMSIANVTTAAGGTSRSQLSMAGFGQRLSSAGTGAGQPTLFTQRSSSGGGPVGSADLQPPAGLHWPDAGLYFAVGPGPALMRGSAGSFSGAAPGPGLTIRPTTRSVGSGSGVLVASAAELTAGLPPPPATPAPLAAMAVQPHHFHYHPPAIRPAAAAVATAGSSWLPAPGQAPGAGSGSHAPDSELVVTAAARSALEQRLRERSLSPPSAAIALQGAVAAQRAQGAPHAAVAGSSAVCGGGGGGSKRGSRRGSMEGELVAGVGRAHSTTAGHGVAGTKLPAVAPALLPSFARLHGGGGGGGAGASSPLYAELQQSQQQQQLSASASTLFDMVAMAMSSAEGVAQVGSSSESMLGENTAARILGEFVSNVHQPGLQTGASSCNVQQKGAQAYQAWLPRTLALSPRADGPFFFESQSIKRNRAPTL
jgi:hypothetical protein